MEADKSKVWRVVDANLNRLSEGLRLIEDIARMIFNDAEITEQLKTIRHETVRGNNTLNTQLLQARDSTGDIGIDLRVKGEPFEKDVHEIIVANSRRAQESLRVLEEMAKLPYLNLDSGRFKKARFDLYTIEKELYSRLLRQDKIAGLSGLYIIVDSDHLNGKSHIEIAEKAIKGGARTIQLRDKHANKKALLEVAQQLRDLCSTSNVLFIVNDYLDIALAVKADGLHIGQEDLPVPLARDELPIDMLLGCSASAIQEAKQAEQEGADYIGFGSIFPTGTKSDISVTGLEALRIVKGLVNIPVVAIGGINKNNIKDVMASGASAAAVISAVASADDPEGAARELAGMINE